jgi:hypothetical protein
MRHDRIQPAWSYRDAPRHTIPAQPLNPRADRAVRMARALDWALPRLFVASIALALAAAIWGAFGGPLP